MSGPFAVRYTEWSRSGKMKTLEREFATAEARERFVEKVSARDSFGSVLAFSDPPENVPKPETEGEP